VQTEASSELAGAGKAFSWRQIVTQDAQNDLGYELVAQTNLASS